MTPAQLLAELRRCGVTVEVTDAGKIALEGPEEVLTEEVYRTVMQAKQSLLMLLRMEAAAAARAAYEAAVCEAGERERVAAQKDNEDWGPPEKKPRDIGIDLFLLLAPEDARSPGGWYKTAQIIAAMHQEGYTGPDTINALRSLTAKEVLSYRLGGWRLRAPAFPAASDMPVGGKGAGGVRSR